MALPQSVEEAANLAEELHSKMFPQEPTEPLEDTPVVVEDETPPDVIDEEDDDDVIDTPLTDDINELKKFRDRYMSLKGKYNAEVPRLAAELRELRDQVNKPKVEAPVVPEVDDDEEYLSTVSEEYGEDFINAIRKVIQHEVKPIIKPVQDQVQITQTTQQDAAKESFKSYLDTAVDKGNWREVWDNADPKFVEFLKEPDPSGLYTYGDLVEMYNENWDGDRLAKVFNTYFDLNKQPDVQPSTKRTTAPNPQKDALIAPNRNNTQPTPNTEGKRIWTNDSFMQFQKDERVGKYSKEESDALWADLQSAPMEGRMR